MNSIEIIIYNIYNAYLYTNNNTSNIFFNLKYLWNDTVLYLFIILNKFKQYNYFYNITIDVILKNFCEFASFVEWKKCLHRDDKSFI